MALFVIICGILLVLGGATSLLFGFDIVLTERGMAMVIGGTVALSGGVVAMGIGFTLRRLSQLLASMEGPVKARRPVPTDRPVVPMATSVVAPENMSSPENRKSPALQTPILNAPGLAATGVKAAAIVGSLGLAKYTSPEADAAAAIDADISAPTIRELAAQPTQKSADLEEELARALAETDGAEKPPSFVEFLAHPAMKPKGRKRKNQEEDPQEEQDPAQRQEDTPLLPEEARSTEIEVEAALAEAANQQAANGASSVVETRQHPEILGSYTAGGRSYSMYADGSVEAVTEHGVERFSSLEDLRQHLAKP